MLSCVSRPDWSRRCVKQRQRYPPTNISPIGRQLPPSIGWTLTAFSPALRPITSWHRGPDGVKNRNIVLAAGGSLRGKEVSQREPRDARRAVRAPAGPVADLTGPGSGAAARPVDIRAPVSVSPEERQLGRRRQEQRRKKKEAAAAAAREEGKRQTGNWLHSLKMWA
ncbi:Hypothetical predicted protein [Podarcis lilfordi]|uniref:Uncharacterized protein n=1 Tax=Podarcis lilfordi TaxID=74358 RepID=A0AA35LAB5_9SAUR|nr:Hypothetical predicted protein [Podarcis lilfordi]